MKNTSVIEKEHCLMNHIGGKGEIGATLMNHTVYQTGTIGNSLLNHHLNDGAPNSKDVLQFECDETSLAHELGLYSYPARSFVVSKPGDIFQVGEELKPGIEWLINHYDRIGISHAGKFIYDYTFFPDRYPEHKLSVFFFGKEADRARPDKKRLLATEFFNSKNNVIRLAQGLGVRTPITKCFSFVSEVDLREYTAEKFPLVVKMANSVSGLGFKKCYNLADLISILEKISKISGTAEFQIQEFLEGAEFLSVQWWINEAGMAEFITGTCNFIEGDANHSGNWGNEKIPHYALRFFTSKMAAYGAQAGLRDWIGFDIALHKGLFYLIECNPRYTGAAYPFIAVKKLFGNDCCKVFWAHRNYHVDRQSIKGFSLNGLEYNPQKKFGWIAINPGPLTVGDGKLGALWVGEEKFYHNEENKLREMLG